MLRTIIWLLASVLLITFLRGVIGIILKGVGQLFQGEQETAQQQPRATAARSQPATESGFGGELVKDPVCGTFVPPMSSLTKKVRGEAFFFCSPECRDKYV
jgi:YHS domain-containing protein